MMSGITNKKSTKLAECKTQTAGIGRYLTALCEISQHVSANSRHVVSAIA